jgi:RNA polymerase sigma factor (sigma-70 family)
MEDLAASADVARLTQTNFADFYRHRREPVFRALALTLRNEDLAADAVEEAMARAYERWRAVSGYVNQEGWIFRVGLNWARTRARKVRREVSTGSPPEASRPDSLPDPDLAKALGALTLEARTVVVLRHYLDMSYDQIAAALDIPPGTAKSRLHYAMRELRRYLEVEA